MVGPVPPFSSNGLRHINFWSLDVEGSELAILKTVNWDEVQIDIILAETIGPNLAEKPQMAREVRDFMKERGYTLIKSVTVTNSDIFVHKSVCPKYMLCMIDADAGI